MALIAHNDIITLRLVASDTLIAKFYGKEACIGGKSHVRSSDRARALGEDQLVGQLGNIALSKWLTGSITPYMQSRWVAGKYPLSGDSGSDIIGSNIDVKASLMRGPENPLDYHLLVRPPERYANHVYILALVELVDDDDTRVHLVGWAKDSDLPLQPSTDQRFLGAHALQARELRALPPFRWWR